LYSEDMTNHSKSLRSLAIVLVVSLLLGSCATETIQSSFHGDGPHISSITWNPESPAVGQAVQFHCNYTGHEPITFSWKIGGGSRNSVEANPTFSFDSVGTYRGDLTITDNTGKSTSSSFSFRVD
jgi:PKD repeat protein